jgi:hypothetical protein
MPMLDTTATRQTLETLRPQIAAVFSDPERARALARRLSRLASHVTEACEKAFMALLEASAA